MPDDESAATYQSESYSGGSWLVDPAAEYRVVTMLVKNASVSVHSATVLNPPGKNAAVNDSADELF